MTPDFIRPATSEDAERLAELEIALFPDNCINERTIRRQIEEGECWVVGNPVVGFILTKKNGCIDILRLGVLPEARNKGIGAKLLRKILRNQEEIILTVLKSNENAIRLYKRYGFIIVGCINSANSWVMARASYLS